MADQPTALTTTTARLLTAEAYQRLADVPPELGWLADDEPVEEHVQPRRSRRGRANSDLATTHQRKGRQEPPVGLVRRTPSVRRNRPDWNTRTR